MTAKKPDHITELRVPMPLKTALGWGVGEDAKVRWVMSEVDHPIIGKRAVPTLMITIPSEDGEGEGETVVLQFMSPTAVASVLTGGTTLAMENLFGAEATAFGLKTQADRYKENIIEVMGSSDAIEGLDDLVANIIKARAGKKDEKISPDDFVKDLLTKAGAKKAGRKNPFKKRTPDKTDDGDAVN